MSVKKNSMSVSLKMRYAFLSIGLALTGVLMTVCGGTGSMNVDGNGTTEPTPSACVPSSSGADRDCDGVANAGDNCPTIPNPDQQATGAVDPNGAGDACDNVVDDDDDGLIEIWHLEALSNIRYDLDGSHYDDEEADSGDRDAGSDAGCPVSGCNGYELMRDLDFDDATSYLSGTVNTMWTGGTGWDPIGDDANRFIAIFDGNDNTITNLLIARDDTDIGLFGVIGSNNNPVTLDGAVRNLALNAVRVEYTGRFVTDVGALAGEVGSGGRIVAVSGYRRFCQWRR